MFNIRIRIILRSRLQKCDEKRISHLKNKILLRCNLFSFSSATHFPVNNHPTIFMSIAMCVDAIQFNWRVERIDFYLSAGSPFPDETKRTKVFFQLL